MDEKFLVDSEKDQNNRKKKKKQQRGKDSSHVGTNQFPLPVLLLLLLGVLLSSVVLLLLILFVVGGVMFLLVFGQLVLVQFILSWQMRVSQVQKKPQKSLQWPPTRTTVEW